MHYYWFKRRGWKFLEMNDGVIRSPIGNAAWEPGAWYSVPGRILLCENGFHCSPSIRDAKSYAWGNVIAEVEGAGSRNRGHGKKAFRHMRIVRAWHWDGQDDRYVSDLRRSCKSERAIQKILETMLREREEI